MWKSANWPRKLFEASRLQYFPDSTNIDPEANQASNLPTHLVDTDQSAADSGW
jgi:hypothetical protein